MDKTWQDIFYIDTTIPFNPIYENSVLWAQRQIKIINIAFGTHYINIQYIKNDKYQCKKLEKRKFCKLIIS